MKCAYSDRQQGCYIKKMAMIEQNGGKKENNLSISIEEKTTTVELLSYIGVISIDCRLRSKKKRDEVDDQSTPATYGPCGEVKSALDFRSMANGKMNGIRLTVSSVCPDERRDSI